MRIRPILHLGILLLAVILIVSFTYAGYLLSIRVRPFSPSDLRVSATPGHTVRAEDLARGAEEKLRKHEVEQALVDFRKALSMNPKSVETQMGLARGELLAGREETAAAEYEKALELAPKNSEALFQAARIYSHRPGTWAKSEARFKKYLTARPDDAQAQLELARISAWRGTARQAQALFSRNAVARLMTYNDWRAYAFALVKAGSFDDAQAILKKITAEHG